MLSYKYVDVLFTQEYKKKIGEYQKRFDDSMKSFDFCVLLEAFKGVHSLGELGL